MLGSNVSDKLRDKNRLTDAGSSEETDLTTPLRKGR